MALIAQAMERITRLSTPFENSSVDRRPVGIQDLSAKIQQQQAPISDDPLFAKLLQQQPVIQGMLTRLRKAAIQRGPGADQTTRTGGLFPGSGFGRGAIGLFGRGAIVTDTVGKRRTRA